jgi:hypothetical protein
LEKLPYVNHDALRFFCDALCFFCDALCFFCDALCFFCDALRFFCDALRFFCDALRHQLEKAHYSHNSQKDSLNGFYFNAKNNKSLPAVQKLSSF